MGNRSWVQNLVKKLTVKIESKVIILLLSLVVSYIWILMRLIFIKQNFIVKEECF